MANEFDALIIGSGPNGLSAAIRLQQLGLRTALYEQAATVGGAVKTEQITLPGFQHDMGASILPLGLASPFFQTLPLQEFGLEWVHPPLSFVHPFPDGSTYAAYRSIEETSLQFGKDRQAYISLMGNIVREWDKIGPDLLKPLGMPRYPLPFMFFGLKALLPARTLVNRLFKEDKTRTFFYGCAAHSTLPLTNLASSSFGLVLLAIAHKYGWPFPKGGAASLTRALVSYYESIGGKIQVNFPVTHINELPLSETYLFDLTPRQLLRVGGTQFSGLYRKRMNNYRYGAGIFKIDWALSDPIPFTNKISHESATVHLGATPQEIEDSERLIFSNRHAERPYVIVAQHTLFDSQRAPEARHTAWAYCHAPHGSREDRTDAIEAQIERVAPGFKKLILARATHDSAEMEAFNPNLVGGDINGGIQDLGQLFTRPIAKWSPYSTPDSRVYICSSSTPPGGGVHGMNGFHAAEKVINDHFKNSPLIKK